MTTDQLVDALQTIACGDAWNVPPQSAVLRGIVRTFSPVAQDLVERCITETAQGIAVTFGIAAQVRYERRYSPTVNAGERVRLATAAATVTVDEAAIDTSPSPTMAAEDFAFLQRAHPGAYI